MILIILIGNVEDLCLSFEADEQVFGKVESHELKFVSKWYHHISRKHLLTI